MVNSKVQKVKEKLQRREKTPEEIHLDDCRKQASLVKKMENRISTLKDKIIKTDRDKISAKDQYERKLKQLEANKINMGNEIQSVSSNVEKEREKYTQMGCPKF